MKFAQDIVLAPVITENSMAGIADKKYTFKVATNATKVEIAQASALLQAVLGDMWQAIVSNPLSQGISLREISGFLQAALPESALNQLDAQLAKIPVE